MTDDHPLRASRLKTTAALLCLSLSAACTTPRSPPPGAPPSSPSSASASPSRPVVALAIFDGVYRGTRTPDVGSSQCGFQSAVSYEVSGSHVWLRTHKKRRFIDGSVDPRGQFLMTDESGAHRIAGTIVGGHLTGTETASPHHHRRSRMDTEPGAVCLAQIDATHD